MTRHGIEGDPGPRSLVTNPYHVDLRDEAFHHGERRTIAITARSEPPMTDQNGPPPEPLTPQDRTMNPYAPYQSAADPWATTTRVAPYAAAKSTPGASPAWPPSLAAPMTPAVSTAEAAAVPT